MQKYIINNVSGYLVKDLDIQNTDFDYLYQKKMIIELSKLQEKKYKCKYFLTEVGKLFLELNDYETRYNVLNKYVNLRSNMNFMNKEYLRDIDDIYPAMDSNFKYPICFYKGQIYSLESIVKKIMDENKNYNLEKSGNYYLIKNDNRNVAKIIYKNKGVYSLR
mgnify:FL=1